MDAGSHRVAVERWRSLVAGTSGAAPYRGLADDLETAAALCDQDLQEHDLPALERAHPVVSWSRRLELAAKVRAAVMGGDE